MNCSCWLYKMLRLDASTGQFASKEDDDCEHCEDDSDPEEEVQRLNQSAREEEDDGDDRDNDEKSVHSVPFGTRVWGSVLEALKAIPRVRP